ncbi:pre-mRNA-splicing factor SYF1-like protein [Achlya hypogyna]|uniref:Pre-mRNA-splicing factor SYF1-like protein n=1 Tax=Achlya hypogyna TaxID=1202772 RepID=A0A1V9YQZ9_ACHHY|nr:pre-mRNA-splicing factor SYF1-like protein [Achlya hypogyna]
MTAAMVEMDDVRAFLQTEVALEAEFEDSIARNPYSIETWTSYLNLTASEVDPAMRKLPERRVKLFRRALALVPLSYKLWKRFIDETYQLVRGLRIDAPEYGDLRQIYEDALVHLHKMPRIWLNYTALLRSLRLGTATRRVFDRALRALPITQHKRIWAPYLEFVHEQGVHPTAISVYRRYLMLEPAGREDFVRYLQSVEQYEEASVQLVQLINEDQESTKTSRHDLWMQLCTMVSQHPEQVSSSLHIDRILRSGLSLFTDEVGRLWCALATYYIRLGMFEAARDIYEEALLAVLTVRDFSVVFDAYVKFIEAMIAAEMDESSVEVDRLLVLYEDLAERRPKLVNAVLLRQNPHSVKEWQKRIALMSDPIAVVHTYTEALKTIDPAQAPKASALWIAFAAFYEAYPDAANARKIFAKALAEGNFKSADEYAAVVVASAEMELRLEEFDAALDIVRRGCATYRKSAKLWALRLDLEESLGDVASTKAAYDRTFELKIVTPTMVLQYTAYLQEHAYFEDSFQVFERAIALFPFPHVYDIWLAYLKSFVARYEGRKLERARDLFNQVLSAVPTGPVAVTSDKSLPPVDMASTLYAEYARVEETYGLWRNATAIYERATNALEGPAQLAMYQRYVAKAQALSGVVQTRSIYERAMEHLPDTLVWQLALKFAVFETALGELERARAVYRHASQFCDPRRHEDDFWAKWHAFEIAHGSEDSFLEMLRIKRSVSTQYAQVNYIGVATAASSLGMVPAAKTGDAMVDLERTAATEQEPPAKKLKANDEEIDIDDDDEEKNAEEIDIDMDIEEKAVPAAVFGRA